MPSIFVPVSGGSVVTFGGGGAVIFPPSGGGAVSNGVPQGNGVPTEAILPTYEGVPKPGDVNPTSNPRGPGLQCAKLDEWVGLAYGVTRVCLSQLTPTPGDNTSANIAWGGLEGPIESIDAHWLNGVNIEDFTSTTAQVGYANFLGTDPQSLDSWLDTLYTGETLATTAWVRTFFQAYGIVGPDGWGAAIPGGKEDIELGIDLHGRLLYDPRDASTAFSSNPALVIWDLLVNFARVPAAKLNATSFSAAADICDALVGSPALPRFSFDGVFAAESSLDSMLHAVRLCCNGEIYLDQGLYCLFIDVEQAGAPVMVLDDRTNFKDVTYDWIDAGEQPTRVVVEYPNAANGFQYDSVTVDNPLLATDEVELREARYRVEGCTLEVRARRIATYVLNQPTLSLRISGETTFEGILLQRGSKVAVTTSEGLVEQEALVSDLTRLPGGLWTPNLRQYDAAVYGDAALSGTLPPHNIPPDQTADPDDITVTDATGQELVVGATVNRVTTINIYQRIEYTLPAADPTFVPQELVVRGIRDASAGSATWASIAGTEIIVPLIGNRPPTDATHFNLVHPGVIKTVRLETRDANGNLTNTADTVGITRIIIRVRSTLNALSAGVTVDVGASTPTTPVTPPGLNGIPKIEEFAGDGSTVTFTVAETPISDAACLVFFAGTQQPLLSGAWSRSGKNFTFDVAPAAGGGGQMAEIVTILYWFTN